MGKCYKGGLKILNIKYFNEINNDFWDEKGKNENGLKFNITKSISKM